MSLQDRVLVIGLGNPILSDDGIGPRVVNDLQRVLPAPRVDYRTCSAGGLEMLDLLQGYGSAVIIDAIRTRAGVPGTVYYFTLDELPDTRHIANLHAVGLPTAIAMAEHLGLPVPRPIRVVAIEIVEDLVASERLTPPLAERYDGIAAEVRKWLERILLSEARCRLSAGGPSHRECR
jgi:hydrogenase maturation protease